mmetsp:Transcript_23357/g.33523  ORF Transcript_23357/g.33523 Transcript_23357/m.33523 type:complete len:200 (-) Transcript_23357:215-814(-)
MLRKYSHWFDLNADVCGDTFRARYDSSCARKCSDASLNQSHFADGSGLSGLVFLGNSFRMATLRNHAAACGGTFFSIIISKVFPTDLDMAGPNGTSFETALQGPRASLRRNSSNAMLTLGFCRGKANCSENVLSSRSFKTKRKHRGLLLLNSDTALAIRATPPEPTLTVGFECPPEFEVFTREQFLMQLSNSQAFLHSA